MVRTVPTNQDRKRASLIVFLVAVLSGETPSLGVGKASAYEERSAKAVARRTPPSSKQVVYLRPYFQIGKGGLVLGRASRLDAFSAYPDRPWLPGWAPGGTTGTPAGRPSRSSRTKERFPQASYAHGR